MKCRILTLIVGLFAGSMSSVSISQPIALVNAKVYTMGRGGELRSGVVVMNDGKIVAVGDKVSVPADARVIDVSGMIITPGLVAAVTPLALADLADHPAADDSRTSSSQISAAFDVRFAVNPASPFVEEARAEGVTAAIVTPSAGMRQGNDAMPFSGTAVAIHLGTATDLVLSSGIAVVLTAGRDGAMLAGGGRPAQMALLADLFDKVRLFARDPRAFDENRLRPLDMSRADLEALRPVIEGKTPLLVSVRRASDILNMLEFAKQQKLKLILADADEAWLVAEEIAAARVPVVIDPEMNVPGSLESRHTVDDNAARLMQAGVLVAYQPRIARLYYRIRTPRFLAGRTVSRGVSHQQALAAITSNPARIFGMEREFGTIETGKRADLVVWSGDPLEVSTAPEMVFIGGVEQSLETRSTALRDKYIDVVLPGAAEASR
jgi:imidazolonepropionase-like amidohydrolase